MLNRLARMRRRVPEPAVNVTDMPDEGRIAAATPAAEPSGSLADIPFANAAEAPDAVVVRRKVDGAWVDVTASALADEVAAVARGLIARGLPPGGRVALMSRTTYEWMLLDLATWAAGGVVVPIYPTSAAEQARWILSDSDAFCCLAETSENTDLIAATGLSVPAWRIEGGLVDTLRAEGERVPAAAIDERREKLGPDDTATIIYTSGTIGMPKGCVLTHGSLLAEVDSIAGLLLPPFRAVSPEEPSTLLFLPLAHVLGRSVQLACLRARVVVGHSPSVRPDDLRPDLASFRPTFLVGIPYVYEKIHATARQQAADMGKAGAFRRAERIAVRYGRLALEVDPRSSISAPELLGLRLARQLYDLLVYRRIRAALGGHVWHAISGGSAMPPWLIHFFAGAGIAIYEGYGLTETFAAITINPPLRPRPGTVGRPVPGAAVRISRHGEIEVRGRQLFSGYHNNPDAPESSGRALRLPPRHPTKFLAGARILRGDPDASSDSSPLQDEGWFATGDLGTLDDDGYLTITGRAKEILVTSTGKNVSPTVLEDRLRANALVSQCIVVGDGKPYVAALLTLDPEAVEHWRKHSADTSEAGLRAALQEAVDETNTAVSRAESIRAFTVVDDDFTEENGLLTPSLKLRRARVLNRYADEIERLYASGGGGAGTSVAKS